MLILQNLVPAGGGSGSSGSSNLTVGQVNITGLTTIDLSTVSGKDIILLKSANNSEIIVNLINYSVTKEFTLVPDPNLTVTFIDDITTYLMRLQGAQQIINGTLFGFIKFRKRNAGYYQTAAIPDYNPLS